MAGTELIQDGGEVTIGHRVDVAHEVRMLVDVFFCEDVGAVG